MTSEYEKLASNIDKEINEQNQSKNIENQE